MLLYKRNINLHSQIKLEKSKTIFIKKEIQINLCGLYLHNENKLIPL
jgi:hypothetical protein